MKKYLIILFAISFIYSQYYTVNIEDTGESTLFIFQNSITSLNIGDELGIFDATGIDQNGDINEILVGSGIWQGNQLNISAVASVNLSSFGGPILPGSVSGNSMVLKVWDISEQKELNATYDIAAGLGTFNGLFTAISEIYICEIPEGACDCDGNILDQCGVCGGLGAIYDCGCTNIVDGFCDCDNNFEDCAGVCGGTAELDECGVCNGDNLTCIDCNGIPNGDNILDQCGICDNNSLNDCIQDCSGVWGGTAIEDECGSCNGPGAIYECGCYNVPIGYCNCNLDVFDECGVCGGEGPQVWCGFPDFVYVCSQDECSEDGIGGDDGGTTGGGTTGGTTGGGSDYIDYESEIEPIFENHCIECHSYGGGYFGGLDLSSYENLMIGGSSGDAVYPYYSSASLIIQKLNGTASGEQMPPDSDPLDEDIISLIANWIDQGAIGPDSDNNPDFGCNDGEIEDCNGNCFSENLIEDGFCNNGLDGGADFNCSSLYFDGNCTDNFENCNPDCPVGILDFGNVSVNFNENKIVGQLEIVMDCQFEVNQFDINLSDGIDLIQLSGGTATDNIFDVSFSGSSIFANGNENSLLPGEQTILIFDFETDSQEICFDNSNITTSIGIQYGAVLGGCIALDTYFEGWNWISLNQTFDDMSLNSILSSLSNNAEFIKSQSGYADYYEDFGWFGTLESINNLSMYKLKMQNSDAIALKGEVLNSDDVEFNLFEGWNWIGYTPNISLDVNIALQNIPSGNAEFLKSQSGYTDYYESFGWFGTLEIMQPLEGYLLKLSNDTDFIYNDNTFSKFGKYDTRILIDDYNLNIYDYEYNGTITSSLFIDDSRVDTYDYTLIAYNGMECVGYTNGLYFPFNGTIVFPLMVYGNFDGSEIVFKVYDNIQKKYLNVDEKIIFSSDMILGDGFDPVPLNIMAHPNKTSIQSIYPNPFNPSTEIHYALEEDMSVRISIYDIRGRVVDQLVEGKQLKGQYSILWTAQDLASGIYFLQMDAGKYSSAHKLILIK